MGKYLDIIRQVEEAQKQRGQEVMVDGSVQALQSGVSGPDSENSAKIGPLSGCWITWEGADGRPRGPTKVDFLHTYSTGAVWAFVTLPPSWAVVNTKYATLTESAGAR